MRKLSIDRLKRPMPPDEVLDVDNVGLFVPALDLMDWMRETFIVDGALLLNEEHEHLREAHVGVLWTNVGNSRHGQMIAGNAGIPGCQGDKWIRGRHDLQLREWFGDIPDFLVTLFAPYAAECDNAHFCALCDHELLHCGQAKDLFGERAFKIDGSPRFCVRGHDVEEFVSIVERYGAGAAAAALLLWLLLRSGRRVFRLRIFLLCAAFVDARHR